MTRPGWSPAWDAWRPEHDEWLRQHAGSAAVGVLACEFSREFAVERTPAALRIRAKRLGISLWMRGYSLRDVEQIFGTDHRVIVRWWVLPGLLRGRRWQGRGPNLGWWFERNDLEAFVREHGYAYHTKKMQGGHPLQMLAEAVQRRDPWVGRDELLKYVEIADVNLKRWMQRGLVPHVRRYGAGGKGEIVVRASELPTIRERILAGRTNGRSRASLAARQRLRAPDGTTWQPVLRFAWRDGRHVAVWLTLAENVA